MPVTGENYAFKNSSNNTIVEVSSSIDDSIPGYDVWVTTGIFKRNVYSRFPDEWYKEIIDNFPNHPI
jgi:hypothetical protein